MLFLITSAALYAKVHAPHSFCKTTEDWVQSDLEAIRGDLVWFGHFGNGVCYVGNNGGAQACANICSTIPDCLFFSTSTTQDCYGCFIYKSCDSPITTEHNYHIYQMLQSSGKTTCSRYSRLNHFFYYNLSKYLFY